MLERCKCVILTHLHLVGFFLEQGGILLTPLLHSEYGALSIPLSVIIAVIRLWSVTSKEGL